MGKGVRGITRRCERSRQRVPVFPDFPNERSMLRIERLCEYVRKLIENGEGGGLLSTGPQLYKDSGYGKTARKRAGKANSSDKGV